MNLPEGWTNERGIPLAVVNAITNDAYDRGHSDYTVTQLLNPPQMEVLKSRHRTEITRDVSDMIFALLGSAVHTILERSGNGEVETRLYKEVEGQMIGGQFDQYDNGVLRDYKIMSVWEVMNGLKPEKAQQMNMLAHLARHNGMEVNQLEIVSIYRDWSRTKAATEPNYPRTQIEVHVMPLWMDADASAFITERVTAHLNAALSKDDELPPCSDDDIWADAKPFAIYTHKNGQPTTKRARRILPTEEEAIQWVEDNQKALKSGEEYVITQRETTPRRCQLYCDAAPFCSQWKNWQERNA